MGYRSARARKTARQLARLRQLLISEAQHHTWLCEVELARPS